MLNIWKTNTNLRKWHLKKQNEEFQGKLYLIHSPMNKQSASIIYVNILTKYCWWLALFELFPTDILRVKTCNKTTLKRSFWNIHYVILTCLLRIKLPDASCGIICVLTLLFAWNLFWEEKLMPQFVLQVNEPLLYKNQCVESSQD